MPDRLLHALVEQREAVLIDADDSVAKAAREMSRLQQNAALVVAGSRTIGILTETDIVRRVIAEDLDPARTPARAAMTRNPVTARAEHSLGQALYLMHAHRVHHIPVVHRGKAIGMVYASDALASDLREYATEAELLDQIAEIL